MACVGIIANPESGKDIRRLVSLASSFSNHEKVLILRRVLAGLAAAGVEEALAFDDAGGLGAAALEGLAGTRGGRGMRARLLDVRARGEADDSTRAAARMRQRGVACIVVLGGDGTCRAVAKGCGPRPLVPLSTGTNNAFPQAWEGTVAGLAAGCYARHPRRYAAQLGRSKRLLIRLRGGVETALIDLAVIRGAHAGARAIWDVDRVEALALTRCPPGGLGLSALGASLSPVGPEAPEGLWMRFGPGGGRGGRRVLSPIAPGLVVSARVREVRRIPLGETVRFTAAGHRVLAFDGEREWSLAPGEGVEVTLDRKGPRVVDVPALLERAARAGDLARAGTNGHLRARR